MPTIKTAISIEENLYNKVAKLSSKLSIPKSRVFSHAVEHLIERNENIELVREINKAYPEPPDENEKLLGSKIKSKHSKLVKGSW